MYTHHVEVSLAEIIIAMMHTTMKINEKTTEPFGKQGQVALNMH